MQWIQELSEADLSYLDTECIQTIIDFKWQTFTKTFYQYQFGVFLLFISLFITDIVFNSEQYGLDSDKLLIGNLCVRLINVVIVLSLSFLEVMQIRGNGIKNYFR